MSLVRIWFSKWVFALLAGAAVSIVSALAAADPIVPASFQDETAAAHPGLRVTIADKSAEGQAAARVWWPADVRFDRVVVVSPGALVPASGMSAFARVLAQEHGALVFVVDYVWSDFRENPEEQKKAYVYVETLLAGGTQVRGLPSNVRERLVAKCAKGTPRLELFGHSAGGAILAPRTDAPPAGLARVVFFGVSSVFQAPAKPLVPALLIAGAQDGLVSPEGLDALGVLFHTAPVRIPDVNHFCIVSDAKAGDPARRALDGHSPLSASDCARRVADAWLGAKR